MNILDTECENSELLTTAFTHPSYTRENGISYLQSYERLEFLGDAVLKLLMSKLLYDKYPDYKEGDLTKIRSILVSDGTLAIIGERIGISERLILGAGEENSGGRTLESNIACATEAVLGAYYLDGKQDKIEEFLASELLPISDEIDKHYEKYNAKAVLQEYSQKKLKQIPQYGTVDVKGPKHDPEFTVQVSLENKVLARAAGKTKKEAQQNCAYLACEKLGLIKEDKER